MKLAAIALLFASSSAFAGPGCAKTEYAQLKDATKSELVDEYCVAIGRAGIHQKYAAMAKDAVSARHAIGQTADAEISEMQEYNAAQVSCLGAAEDAARVLKRKFGAKPPTCK